MTIMDQGEKVRSGAPAVVAFLNKSYKVTKPGGSVVKNLPANAGDTGDKGSIPGLGRSPGGGNACPLQCSCQDNPTDKGAWWATVHRVAESWTPLKDGACTCTEQQQCNKSAFLFLYPQEDRAGRGLHVDLTQAVSFRKCGREGPEGLRDLPWSHRKSVMSGRKYSLFLLPILGSLFVVLQIRLTKDRFTRGNEQFINTSLERNHNDE